MGHRRARGPRRGAVPALALPVLLLAASCPEAERPATGDPGAPPAAPPAAADFLPPLDGYRTDDDVDAGEVRASLDHGDVPYVEVRRRLILGDDGFARGDITVVTFEPGAGGPARFLDHRFGGAHRAPVEIGGVGMIRVAAEPHDAIAWTGAGFAVVFWRGAAADHAWLEALAGATAEAARGGPGADAQARPDFSGVWRLDAAASRMVGGGGPPSPGHTITWLVDHREPAIAVVVNVRDAAGSHEFAFRCTTDGAECVNELASLGEVRRMTAVWEGDALVMAQRATTPHGDFTARDRLTLSADGEQLVFERVVTNERGDRDVRQLFRKLGPHPSRRPPPDPLPSVDLPPELDRVLRDYERHWHAGRADSLVALFTGDGFIARRGGWVRGAAALRDGLQRTSSDLRLRAVEYATDGRVGWIVGNYGYGDEAATRDAGMFILTLRRGDGGRWLIVADLDGAIRP